MEREELKSIVENVLLAADQPINSSELCKIFFDGTDKDELQSILDELKDEYSARNLQITEVAEGYQLCTRHEYNDFIRKFLKLDRSTRLSQPSLDTLSIIAYKQPLTRQEVDEIRGVDSSGVIKTLLEKKVISPAGRKKGSRPSDYVSNNSKISRVFWPKGLKRFTHPRRFKRGIGRGRSSASNSNRIFSLGGFRGLE